jgi:dienelactone hydrolase
MTITSGLLAGLVSLTALGDMPGARADELVQIASHRAAIWPEGSKATPALLGFLTRPIGPGRFPAVVLLHWCSGFSGHDTQAATILKSWGYVALAVDSLGDANLCTGGGGSAAEALDAYAALRYLAAQSFVASDRIAVMGYSMGATAALITIDKGGIERAEAARFRAAIAYYPQCEYSTGSLTAPALILVGERDDWTPADTCRKLAAHESDIGMTRRSGTGAPINLVVYPNAVHAFDVRSPPHYYLGHFEQFDEDATRDAETRVRAFLRQELGDQTESR